MTYCLRLPFYLCVSAALALSSASAHVTATDRQCNCDALKENFDDRLKELNAKVSQIVGIAHKVHLLEIGNANVPRDIMKLKADVKALQDQEQNTVSNLIHPVTGYSFDEMHKRMQEDEAKMLAMAADVSVMKAERRSLRGAVERMKRDTAVLTPDVQRAVAVLPRMVARMERLFRAGDDIAQLLASGKPLDKTASGNRLNSVEYEKNEAATQGGETEKISNAFPAKTHATSSAHVTGRRHGSRGNIKMAVNVWDNFYNDTAPTAPVGFEKNGTNEQASFAEMALFSDQMNNKRFDNVSEIDFVGEDGNFSAYISNIIKCTDFGSSNDNTSMSNALPCDSFSADVYFEEQAAANQTADASGDLTTEKGSIVSVITFMAEEVLKLRKTLDDGALNRRIEQVEDDAIHMRTDMTKLQQSLMDEMTRSFANISLGMKKTAEILEEHNLAQLESETEDLSRNTSLLWESLHKTKDSMQQVQRLLSDAINSTKIGNNASFHTMKVGILTSLSQLSALNESLQDSLTEKGLALKGELDTTKSKLERQMNQLSESMHDWSSVVRRLNETVERVLVSLGELDEKYNSTIALRDMRLQAKMDDLNQKVFGEIAHLSKITRNNTNTLSQLPHLNGWHPDDAADCPGLHVLAADDHMVLSANNSGGYRAPNLPSDPLPVGSAVRFRCVPAGSHRLIGPAELRCVGAKRWSSKPPRCQPLRTQGHVERSGINTTPSIVYDGLVDDEWVWSDDDGSLIVRPGVQMRLKCLHLPKPLGGNLTWLHNGTSPRDAYLSWVTEGPGEVGENAYVLERNHTAPEHSGTYSCETSEGTRHSISIRILEVVCEAPLDPDNGDVELDYPGQPAPVASKAHFDCRLGYELHGSNETTCLGSGRWSGLPPKCEKIPNFSLPEGSCLRPALQGGLTVSPDKKWYERGSSITYSCQRGKVLVGMESSQCHEGQWMGQSRRCV